MPQFIVAIHHPDNYDPSKEDTKMHHDIDILNESMESKGIRVFVGGLHSATKAKTIRLNDGDAAVSDGPYLKTNEHMGGFWVLEAKNIDEAVEWGRKAAVACRANVEVREFHTMPA